MVFAKNGRPSKVSNTASFSLPPSKEYILYLPLYNGIKSIEFGVPKDSSLAKLKPPAPSDYLIFYGTSITQGGCASRPGMAMPAIVSRKLNRPIINLGFSGNGRMEPEIANLLSELNPAVYILDPIWNMNVKLVSERTEPFIHKIRESHPTTPIILVEDSSIYNRPTSKGNILRKIHTKLTAEGDKNLYFLSNINMLGEDREATVDGCHLTDLGMYRQSEVFIKFLKPILKN
jgi:hypothetical protein